MKFTKRKEEGEKEKKKKPEYVRHVFLSASEAKECISVR